MNSEEIEPPIRDTQPPGSVLSGKTAFVTGASRGVGASVAVDLARAGADVALNYRSKLARAEEVARAITALRRRVLVLQGDITDPSDIQRSFDRIAEEWRKLDILILNASGGLEKDKDPGYAMRLNLDAQLNLVQDAMPLIPAGGRIIFVTSHLAHFYGAKPVYDAYEPVAASKKAGEDALRKLIPEFTQRGIGFTVVSGDLIEGTITPKLLQRQKPGLIEARRMEAGTLPTVEEFAAAIVKAAAEDCYAPGETIYVGSTE
jgi:3-oxoacyl-[acyl-carrier protein] reductase